MKIVIVFFLIFGSIYAESNKHTHGVINGLVKSDSLYIPIENNGFRSHNPLVHNFKNAEYNSIVLSAPNAIYANSEKNKIFLDSASQLKWSAITRLSDSLNSYKVVFPERAQKCYQLYESKETRNKYLAMVKPHLTSEEFWTEGDGVKRIKIDNSLTTLNKRYGYLDLVRLNSLAEKTSNHELLLLDFLNSSLRKKNSGLAFKLDKLVRIDDDKMDYYYYQTYRGKKIGDSGLRISYIRDHFDEIYGYMYEQFEEAPNVIDEQSVKKMAITSVLEKIKAMPANQINKYKEKKYHQFNLEQLQKNDTSKATIISKKTTVDGEIYVIRVSSEVGNWDVYINAAKGVITKIRKKPFFANAYYTPP